MSPKALNLSSCTACAVLWDLDNVQPGPVRLVSAIEEVKETLHNMGCTSQPSVACYANSKTCKSLGEGGTAQGAPDSNHSAVVFTPTLQVVAHNARLLIPCVGCRPIRIPSFVSSWCHVAAGAGQAAGG